MSASVPFRSLASELTEAEFEHFIRLHVVAAAAAKATVRMYLSEARGFRQYLSDAGIALRDLTTTDVREWVCALVESGKLPTTITTKLIVVRRLLDAAVNAGMILSNPATGVKAPKDQRLSGSAAQRALSLKEIGRLVGAIPEGGDIGERDHAIIGLLVGHGLRTIEVERLNLADVDLDRRELVVKGTTRDRLLFLRPDVADRLRVVIEIRRAQGARADDPLFISHAPNDAGGRGKRLGRRGLRFIADRAFQRAGLLPKGGKRAARSTGARVPSCHGLRATNVTRALSAKARIEHVAADVGHADVRTTMRYLSERRRRADNTALRISVEL